MVEGFGDKLTVIDTKVTRGFNTANDLLKTISNNTSGGSLHKKCEESQATILNLNQTISKLSAKLREVTNSKDAEIASLEAEVARLKKKGDVPPPPPRTNSTPSRKPLSLLAAIKGGTPLKKTPKVKTAPPTALPTDPIEQLLQASARSQRQAVGDGSSDDSTDDWNPVDYDGL